MNRKILFTILCLVFTFCVGASFVGCTDELEDQPVDLSLYEFENGTIMGLTELGYEQFDLDIPANIDGELVTTIADGAFKKNARLTNVTMADTVTSIGKEAFAECKRLKTIVFSDNITTIGNNAFFNCNKIETIVLPEKLETISNSCFGSCLSLKSITIKNQVKTIEPRAFNGCRNLTTLHIPASVTAIDFEDGSASFTSMNGLESFTVDANSATFSVKDGNLLSKDGTIFYNYALGKKATEFTLPNGVTYVYAYAFAFEEDLLKVNFATTVERIGYGAFSSCSSLTDVTCGGAAGKLKRLEHRAFNYTPIKNIEIPSTLKYVGRYAFLNCRDIQKVVYYGTPEQWDAINIEDPSRYNNNTFTNASVRQYIIND